MSEIKLNINGTEYVFELISQYSCVKPVVLLNINGNQYVGKAIPNKVPVPDYEILSFRGTGKQYSNEDFWDLSDGKYKIRERATSFWDLNSMLKGQNSVEDEQLEIHSVKRISDGEVFEVGKEGGKWGDIVKFEIENERMYAYFEHRGAKCYIELKDLEKVKPKQPMFKDELGNDLFSDDIIFAVSFETGICNTLISKNSSKEKANNCGYKWFKFKADAENYLLENKPVQVTLKELKDLKIGHWAELTDFFKSKISK